VRPRSAAGTDEFVVVRPSFHRYTLWEDSAVGHVDPVARETSSGCADRAGRSTNVVVDPAALADVSGTCERLRRVLGSSRSELVVCHVGLLTHPDAGTVEALARLCLTARRLGRGFVLRGASPHLRELITLMGLADPLLRGAGLSLGKRRETEEREHPGRVEEEGQAHDATT
jgi:hypothetical protein